MGQMDKPVAQHDSRVVMWTVGHQASVQCSQQASIILAIGFACADVLVSIPYYRACSIGRSDQGL